MESVTNQSFRRCIRDAAVHNTAGTAKLKIIVSTGRSCPVAPIHEKSKAIGKLPQAKASANALSGIRNIPAVTAKASGNMGTARESAITQPPPRATMVFPR
jgi:hypothetical protein